MFHHSANRVAAFLEVSALSISLAQTAGAQYKAGWLRIEVVGGKGGGFGRRSTTWRDKRRVKWAAVRESYMVVLEDPGEVSSLLVSVWSNCGSSMVPGHTLGRVHA